MGLTFKEDCSDLRNSKSIELGKILQSYGLDVQAIDPLVEIEKDRIEEETGINCLLFNDAVNKKYDLIVASVAHRQYKEIDVKTYKRISNESTIYYDLQNIIPKQLQNVFKL